MSGSDPPFVEVARFHVALGRRRAERAHALTSRSTSTSTEDDKEPETVKRPERPAPSVAQAPDFGEGGAESVPPALVPPFDASGPDVAPSTPAEWAAEYGHIPSFGMLDGFESFDPDLIGDD